MADFDDEVTERWAQLVKELDSLLRKVLTHVPHIDLNKDVDRNLLQTWKAKMLELVGSHLANYSHKPNFTVIVNKLHYIKDYESSYFFDYGAEESGKVVRRIKSRYDPKRILEHLQAEKHKGKSLDFGFPSTSNSLGQHRRIGLRHASRMDDVRTGEPARDGGLLLAA
ncbi:hypothetical protein JCM5353_007568 [Sporobolomyces roseus]